jgi:uncharacterized repeat protein (TIGR02543 family)
LLGAVAMVIAIALVGLAPPALAATDSTVRVQAQSNAPCGPASSSPLHYDSAKLIDGAKKIDAVGNETRTLSSTDSFSAEIVDSRGVHGLTGEFGAYDVGPTKFHHFWFTHEGTVARLFHSGEATITTTVVHHDGSEDCYTQTVTVQPLTSTCNTPLRRPTAAARQTSAACLRPWTLELLYDQEFYFSPTGGFLGNGHGNVYAFASGYRQLDNGTDVSGYYSAFGTYATGTPVTIHAVPDKGYRFDGWTSSSGDCLTAARTCSLTMTHNSDVTAHFTVKTYNLTVDGVNAPNWVHDTGDDTTSTGPLDINCGGAGTPPDSDCSGQEAAQHACALRYVQVDCNSQDNADGSPSQIVLVAIAYTQNTQFDSFDGCDTSAKNPTDPTVGYCFINMTSDRSVTVHWKTSLKGSQSRIGSTFRDTGRS